MVIDHGYYEDEERAVCHEIENPSSGVHVDEIVGPEAECYGCVGNKTVSRAFQMNPVFSFVPFHKFSVNPPEFVFYSKM